ncbi:hypothetical protein Pcinc_016146 [Petrolisthes cinctipes]|uniref:Uncharacterized protein n=1 Tax=Petrolisthes cinctipes TaxID=88211 RepID=A0AAE1FWU9_PETCI|nr:hypothetical protein Pcinc_016146 [Petrolisthes cinctipes]
MPVVDANTGTILRHPPTPSQPLAPAPIPQASVTPSQDTAALYAVFMSAYKPPPNRDSASSSDAGALDTYWPHIVSTLHSRVLVVRISPHLHTHTTQVSLC